MLHHISVFTVQQEGSLTKQIWMYFWHYFRECDVRHETELSLFKLTDYLAYKGGSGTEATQW
jgi:hypothetical protein